jgi:deoxyadenosine/deoxycytidine kinase
MRKQLTILCEGNVASGKTTFLNFLRDEKDVEIVPEPLNEWTNFNGINLLEKYYKEPKRYFATFQSFVFLTQLRQYRNLNKNKPIRIIERSVYSAKNCFMETGKDSLSPEEYLVLNEWYKEIDKELGKDIALIIYIRAKPSTSYSRMKIRGRTEESSVSLDLIKKLYTQHENWLIKKLEPCPAPVLILDADKDLNYVKNEADKILKLLRNLPLPVADPVPHTVTVEVDDDSGNQQK